MNTIPTAEETYLKYTQCVMNHKDIKVAMIEFAKLHVEAALKAANKKAKRKEGQIADYKLSDSILNSYPLDKII